MKNSTNWLRKVTNRKAKIPSKMALKAQISAGNPWTEETIDAAKSTSKSLLPLGNERFVPVEVNQQIR